MFADDIIRALLAVGHQVAVGEMIGGQALVTGNPGAFKTREGGAEACPCGPRWELWQR